MDGSSLSVNSCGRSIQQTGVWLLPVKVSTPPELISRPRVQFPHHNFSLLDSGLECYNRVAPTPLSKASTLMVNVNSGLECFMGAVVNTCLILSKAWSAGVNYLTQEGDPLPVNLTLLTFNKQLAVL